LLVNSLTIDGSVIFLVPKKHHDEIIDQLQDNAAVIEQAELYKENIRQNPPSYLTKPNILNNYIQVMLNTIQCLISSMIIEENIYNDHALIVFHQIITIAMLLYYYEYYHTIHVLNFINFINCNLNCNIINHINSFLSIILIIFNHYFQYNYHLN
jgi:hypothetical protein